MVKVSSLNMNPNALVLHQRDAGRIKRLEQAVKENKHGKKREASLRKEISKRKARMAARLKEVEDV